MFATLAILAVWLGGGPSFVLAAMNDLTSLTLLYHNNLNLTDDVSHVGALVLDPFPPEAAWSACEAILELQLSRRTIESHLDDFTHMLAHHASAYNVVPQQTQAYVIRGGLAVINLTSTPRPSLSFAPLPPPSSYEADDSALLPILCRQSENGYHPTNNSATVRSYVTLDAGGVTYTGFRDQKSFRFLGIRYAEKPERWTYPKPHKVEDGAYVQATSYGPACLQPGGNPNGTSEDCLFLNIQTPYLPNVRWTKDLRPVHFWIHGGGFTGGQGSDPGTDGGQLASREDVVTVSMNYRLSTLGFLAVPGTDVKGNYGIADQILALDWVIENIAFFGGDPSRITINGGSAGAGSVRTLLGSPRAIGKFQGAIAMSNLGGGLSLGLEESYATTYSEYLSVAESFERSKNLFVEAGCNQTGLAKQLACLKRVDGQQLVGLPTVARYVVQDDVYVTSPRLDLSGPSGSTAHVPVMFGITTNDGASFTNYPSAAVKSLQEGIAASLGISLAEAERVLDSGLFPVHGTRNLTLDAFNISQRVSTDLQFRCIDQATVHAGAMTGAFASAYYYELTRTQGGYDPDGLGGPATTATYPRGDPNEPYFRLHGGDVAWMFGNLPFLRDEADLLSTQVSVGYFGEFIRSGQPNPKDEYLRLRGYDSMRKTMTEGGRWDAVMGEEGPIRLLDWPSAASKFVDVEQCRFLNYSLGYYL